MKTRVFVACLVACVGMGVPLASTSLAGCGVLAFMDPLVKVTRDSSVAHEKDKALYIDTENGSITVGKAADDKVSIHAEISAQTQERADKAEVVSTRDKDGTLHISVKWPDGKRKGSEGCAFKILLPDASLVHAVTTNGHITCEHIGHDGELESTNGTVKVVSMPGGVKGRTTNGNVEFTEVPRADAGTTNGSVVVTLSDSPEGVVKCETTNGSVTLFVPAGFNQTLDCQTTNGSVNYAVTSAKATKTSKTHSVLVFGTGEPKGSLETTNGSVPVKVKVKEAERAGEKAPGTGH
ncbi:MAG: DUF4097 family beta strand repeat-containing protein [Phycisphaerales bacterium]